MENPTITIKRTKEELRTYNIFSAIERRPFRRVMEYVGPLMGVGSAVIFVIFSDPVFLILGLFLGFYSFMMRRTIKKSSDQSYDTNNLGDIEITMTFSKDSFLTSFGEESKDIEYESLFRVYIRENDMIIYVSKFSGLYINKKSNS